MKTVFYSFQYGLHILQKKFREFEDEEEDIQRPTNTNILEHNLVRNFDVSIVYIRHI